MMESMDEDMKAEIVDEEDPRPAGALSRRGVAALAEVEHRERIYERVVGNLQPIVRFAEVDPKATNPPASWVEEYGWDRAREHMRVAQLCYLPTKDVPYGVKATVDLYRGLESARSNDGNGGNTVNVQINMSGTAVTKLPVMELEKVDGG
jgi:hypothetical protein